MPWIIKPAANGKAHGGRHRREAWHTTLAVCVCAGVCVCYMAYDGFMFKLRASNLMDFVIFKKRSSPARERETERRKAGKRRRGCQADGGG